ncbi:hypothetical protein [Nocardioides sp. InS609-2]|uniref:hypothetical protein n=1 Tax=Nocardioides sp. InS609-2 TaxID=2760705 RepID=UPI0020C011F5|nr:hypothetical protein [Nocardioides sp. InS609-2]
MRGQDLADRRQRPVGIEAVALVGYGEHQHAVVGDHVGQLGQPADQVGDVLDDVGRDAPGVRAAGASASPSVCVVPSSSMSEKSTSWISSLMTSGLST